MWSAYWGRARITNGAFKMAQTASGLLVIGWRLALALVAGIPILTTIGVFLLARFTHVFDAYADERAKLLAQFHNLDKLVAQTERLTATTETIKARISDETWDRQMRWSHKRDMYVKIIERIAELIRAEAVFQQYENAERSTEGPLGELKEMLNDLMRLMEVAPLVLSDRAVKTLWNLRSHTADELFTEEHLGSLKAHLVIFRREARKDLGFAELTDVETADGSKA
jgi:hypothetical protein